VRERHGLLQYLDAFGAASEAARFVVQAISGAVAAFCLFLEDEYHTPAGRQLGCYRLDGGIGDSLDELALWGQNVRRFRNVPHVLGSFYISS
jgi:hypothetical protein